MERLKPEVKVRLISPNRSERLPGVPINLIAIHSTESHNRPGKSDLLGVAGWFQQEIAEASCHVITDADGHSARCVDDQDKAWHIGAYNSFALGIEQIGFAAQGRAEWLASGRELNETARWIARWSIKHGIPIRHGKVVADGTTPKVLRSGVVTHGECGQVGGGHHDPGPYPLALVLRKAVAIKREIVRVG